MPGDDQSHADPLGADLKLILNAGREAGRIAMGFFGRDPEVWYKNGGSSPVSSADIAVDRFLKDALQTARPDYGWLSEETADASDRLTHECVFVVDPIDGTRAYIAGKPTWCVSIAIVKGGQSVAGILVAPALDEDYWAEADRPAFKNGARLLPDENGDDGASLRVAAPKSLTSGLAERIGRPVEHMPHVPSLAYRLAMVADGRLDATLVRPKAHDWDVAAADLILARAGGRLSTLSGEAIVYDRDEIDHGILVAGSGAVMPDLARIVADLQAAAPDAALPKD